MTGLVQQRSMLVILIAACKAAETAFQAAENAVDAELRSDLTRMIARSEIELENITRQIESGES